MLTGLLRPHPSGQVSDKTTQLHWVEQTPSRPPRQNGFAGAPNRVRAAGGEIGITGWHRVPATKWLHQPGNRTSSRCAQQDLCSRPFPCCINRRHDGLIKNRFVTRRGHPRWWPAEVYRASVLHQRRPLTGKTAMQEVVIVAATRTAIGSFGGSLAKISAPDLGPL